MANFGAKIIGNAISGLQAQQARIANASNNIANVNTEGYTRRVVQLETRSGSTSTGGLTIGDGVNVASVLRVADAFLDAAVRTSTSDKAAAEMKNSYLSRIEQLFPLTDVSGSIGSNLTAFFTAFNDLAANPASIELRANAIQAASNLTSSISSTYKSLANIQKEADSRIDSEVSNLNVITSQIAALNEQIRSREGASGHGSAADERDQREVLLQKLSEKISFSQIELADGTVTISLSNGFSLVSGAVSRQLSTTSNPSFATSATPSLYGEPLKYIVFDYDSGAGTSHINLTSEIGQGQGSLGALLEVRGISSPTDTNAFQAQGTIPDIARRIEGLTRTLLTEFNSVYLGSDRDSGTAGFQPSSGDLDGNSPDVFGLFDFAFSGTKDVDGDGQPEASDLNALMASGAVTNFSSILTVAFSDPRRLAAATSPSPTSPFSPGDNTNALAIANLQNSTFTISSGTMTASGITVNDFYNQTVGQVGNLKSAAALAKNVATQNLTAAQNRRDQESAVSLDEEYSSLTVYQQAYQASARMIKIADEMLQTVIGLI